MLLLVIEIEPTGSVDDREDQEEDLDPNDSPK
jgi:hypothetical protein